MSKKRIEWTPEKRKLLDLKPYDKNPRIIDEFGLNQLGESFDEIGVAQPININTDNTILSGHARWKKLMSEDKTGEVLVLVPDRTLTPKQEEAVIVRMNKNIAGKWDFDILANQFEMEDLVNYGFTQEELDVNFLDFKSPEEQETENTYSDKISRPTYTPQQDTAPKLSELFFTEKYFSLIAEIKEKKLPPDIELFLTMAASRHIVFNYESIAEFYCHQNNVVQDLMEKSALVIIDFNKAIEQGFVKLTDEINEIMGSNTGDDEDE